MDVKINNKKYSRLEVFRLLEMISGILKNKEYDIVISTENNDWIQIFKEDNRISIAKKVNDVVYQIYTLKDDIEIQKVISNYYQNQNTPIPQVWDNQINVNEKDGKIEKILIVLFLVLLVVIFIGIKVLNNINLAMLGSFFESIIIIYFGIKRIKENQYEAKPYIMVIVCIGLLIWSISNLVKVYF